MKKKHTVYTLTVTNGLKERPSCIGVFKKYSDTLCAMTQDMYAYATSIGISDYEIHEDEGTMKVNGMVARLYIVEVAEIR